MKLFFFAKGKLGWGRGGVRKGIKAVLKRGGGEEG